MNGNKIFVDTNILIYLLEGEQEIIEMLNGKELVISIINELELLSFPNLTEVQENTIRNLLSDCQIVNINNEIKELAVVLRRENSIKLADAIVAATAYYFNLPLLTADKEFEKLKELTIILYEVG